MSAFGRWLSLRPGEGRPVALLFAWYFCAVGAAFAGRTVRDALFLANVGADKLPLMYIATPVVAALAGALYAAVAARLKRKVLVVGSLVGGALVMAGFYALVGLGQAVEVGLYFAVSVMSSIMISQVWMIASDRFTSRDAKRVFGLVGAGGTAADILIGLVISVLAVRLGAEILLGLCAVLLLGGAAAALALQRGGGAGWEAHGKPRAAIGAPPEVRPPGTAHLKLLTTCIVLGIVVVTVVDFQFKAIAAEAFGADQAAMASWFGGMSVATGVAAFALQLVVTPWVLRNAGVAGALMALPLGLGLGETALVALPGLWVATVLKAGDETVRFSLHDAATQLSYLPVPSSARARMKATIDDRWRPAAQLFSGLTLFGYGHLLGNAVRPLAAGAGLAVVAWLVAAARLRAAYRESLTETLRRRPDALEGLDPAGIPAEEWASLRAGLAAADPRERLAAIDLARPVAEQLVTPLADGLAHPDAEVRRATARALAPTSWSGWARLVEDPDPEVRTWATAARVREDPAARDALAAALAGEPEDARRALRACGPGTEALLADAIAPSRPGLGAAIVARLGELGTAEARDRLLPLLTHPRLGGAAARALARVARTVPLTPEQARTAEARVQEALLGAFLALAAAETMGKAESALAPDGTREANVFARDDAAGAAGLLSKALRERQEAHRERILWLLAARWPGAGLDRVRANLSEPTPSRRANAVELLDATLDGPLRRLVVALVDESPRYEKIAVARPLLDLPRHTREGWLAALLADPSPFVAAAASYYVGAFALGPLRPAVARHVGSADPMLDETARHALAALDAA